MASRQRYTFRDYVGHTRQLQTYCNSAFDGISIAAALQSLSAAALVAASGPYTLADTGAFGASEAYGDVQDRLSLTFQSGLGGRSTYLIPAPLASGVFLPDQETPDFSGGGLVVAAIAVLLARARDSAGYLHLGFSSGKRVRQTRPPASKGDAMVLIQDTVLGAAGIFTFSSIPSSFRHLELIYQVRSDQAAITDILLRLNNDSAADYGYERFDATGAGVSAAKNNSDTGALVGYANGTAATANRPSTGRILIVDYNSALDKNVEYIGSQWNDPPVSQSVRQHSTTWILPNPVTRIDLLPRSGLFVASSRASLYAY